MNKSFKSIKLNNLIKDGRSIFFTASIGKGLELLRGAVFLKVFSPSDFGIIDIINQIVSISKYSDIGLISNVHREYNYDSVNNPTLAKKRKETAYGFELIITLLLFTLLFFTGFFLDKSFQVKVGIVFGAVSFLLTKGLKVIGMDMILNKSFQQYAKFSLVLVIVQNILILSTVAFIGIYSPLVIKSFALILIFAYYYNKYGIRFNFKFDRIELKRQLKLGLFFSGMSILGGLWIFFERFLITHHFSIAEVGLYAASLFIVKSGSSLLDEFIKPVSIMVKQSLSDLNICIIKKYVLYPSILFLFISPPIIYIAQIIINFVEINYLTSYDGFGEVFSVIKWLIPCYGLGSLSGYLLYTKGVDRFIPVYIILFSRFLLIGLLCYLHPPLQFKALLVYFVMAEIFFFYIKLFLIFSKFFNNGITLLVVLVPLSIQLILLFKS